MKHKKKPTAANSGGKTTNRQAHSTNNCETCLYFTSELWQCCYNKKCRVYVKPTTSCGFWEEKDGDK